MVTGRTGVIDMGKHEKRVYLEAIRKRYPLSSSQTSDKGRTLDEFSRLRPPSHKTG
ncbi:MAG: hypothetical protein J0I90_08170 [Nitrosospira sp.]|nr:hypothetical protein [Nitrosospira sp.]